MLRTLNQPPSNPVSLPLLSLLSLLLLLLLFSFSSPAQAAVCPANCPATCTPVSNVNAQIVNNTIYVAPNALPQPSQSGNATNPFSSIRVALQSLRNTTQSSVTIIVEDGDYTEDGVAEIDDTYSGVQPWNGISAGPINRRTIILQSRNGRNFVRVNCTAAGLIRSGTTAGGFLTMTLVVQGITFQNCPNAINTNCENLEVKECSFENLSSAIYSSFQSMVKVTDTQFVGVVEAITFGAVNSSTISDCTFRDSSVDTSGILGLFNGGTHHITNCEFNNIGGGVINYYQQLNVFITGISYIDCTAELLDNHYRSRAVYTDTTLLGTDGPSQSYFQSFNSTVTFNGLVAEDNVSIEQAAVQLVFAYTGSTINFNDIQFTHNSMPLLYLGLVSDVEPSFATGTNLDISENQFPGSFIEVYGAGSMVTLTHSQFTNNSFENNVLFCDMGSTCTVSSVDFNENELSGCGIIHLQDEASAIVTDVHFNGNAGADGVGICAEFPSTVVVDACEFFNNTGTEQGGAIFCSSCQLTLTNSQFYGNELMETNSMGGALYLTTSRTGISHQVSILVTDCDFTSNVAQLGGGVYANVRSYEHGPIEIRDSNFTSNYATKRGGAYFSGDDVNHPNMTSVIFTDNEAMLSGPTNAGPAIRLTWTSTTPNLHDGVSGVEIPSLAVTLQDSFLETVFLDDTECLILSVSVEDRSTNEVTGQPVGEIQKAVLRGQTVFSNLIATGDVGDHKLVVRSSSATFDPLEFFLELNFTIMDCPPGFTHHYVLGSDFPVCTKITCEAGCFNGECTDINQCVCNEGFSGNACEIQGDIYYPQHSQPGVIAIVIVTAVLLVLALFFVFTMILYRETPVFKSASPLFCVLAICGVIVAYISIFTFIGKPDVGLCTSNLWLVNMAFVISFSAILTKNWRIYRIFENKRLRVRVIGSKELLFYSAVPVAIEILLLIIWSAAQPPNGYTGKTGFVIYEACGDDTVISKVLLIIMIVYNALITAAAAWLAFKTRNVMSAFRDSTGIALSVYNFGVIAVIILPLIYLAKDTLSPESLFFIKVITILFVSTFGMLALFGPKVYIAYFAKENNVLPKDKVLKNTSSLARSASFLKSSETELGNLEGREAMVSMIGVLGVQSRYLRIWKKKTVQLHSEAGLFTIFDVDKSQVGEVVDVANISVMNRDDVDGGCFSVRTSQYTYTIQAEDKEAARKWISAINKARRIHAKEEEPFEGDNAPEDQKGKEKENS